MSWADFLFAAIIIGLTIRGVFTGLICEVFGLVSGILALMIASILYVPVGRLFAGVGGDFDISGPISFIVVFLVALVLLTILSKVLSTLIDATIARWVNHVFGGVFGLLKALVVCAAIVLLIHRLPTGMQTREEVTTGPIGSVVSVFAHPLSWVVESLAPSATEDDSWWREIGEDILGVEDDRWELLDEMVPEE